MAKYEVSDNVTKSTAPLGDNFSKERLPIERNSPYLQGGQSLESAGAGAHGGGQGGGSLAADRNIGLPNSQKSGEIVVPPIQDILNHSAGRSSEK